MNRDKSHKIDFSEGRHRQMLVWQRQQMWTEKELERNAGWVNMSSGMRVVDVGCGLGYLGYAYWKYFGQNGSYIGIDINDKLLKDAEVISNSWIVGGKSEFLKGDSYKLPVPDNFADLVMCQTLMIHLEQPKKALAEMYRVLKPGGRIFCQEPDNFRSVLAPVCSSLPEYDVETLSLIYKINLIANKGRIKMGRGDKGIAPNIPHFLNQLGFVGINIRARESVSFLEPPYEAFGQQERIENMKKYWLNEKNFDSRTDEQKEEFLACGGNINDFEKLIVIGKKQRDLQLKQMENNEFYICGAYPFYLIKAEKPSK